MDWREWKPDVEMTLCFIIKDGKIMLIRKKRGIGKGKVNGPGGKVEEGEDIVEAAIREVEEETGLIPKEPEKVAELFFEGFEDKMLVHVFISEDYEGEIIETEEAEPFWVDIDNIPYEEMWEDDRIWLPEILSGNLIRFWARFENNKMIEWEIEEV